jgi:hypothetical protein
MLVVLRRHTAQDNRWECPLPTRDTATMVADAADGADGFSSVLWFLMILVPTRPSRLNVISICPLPAGRSVPKQAAHRRAIATRSRLPRRLGGRRYVLFTTTRLSLS